MQAHQSWLPSILSSSIKRPSISRTAWVLGEKIVRRTTWGTKIPWQPLKTRRMFRSQEAAHMAWCRAIQIPNLKSKSVKTISKWWFCKLKKCSKHMELKLKGSFNKWSRSRVKTTHSQKMFTAHRLDTQQFPSPTTKVNSKSSFEMK